MKPPLPVELKKKLLHFNDSCLDQTHQELRFGSSHGKVVLKGLGLELVNRMLRE